MGNGLYRSKSGRLFCKNLSPKRVTNIFIFVAKKNKGCAKKLCNCDREAALCFKTTLIKYRRQLKDTKVGNEDEK